MGYAGMNITLAGASTGAIGHLTRIEWDGPRVGVIDCTDSSSTNKWREKIPGLKDAGRLTVDLMFAKALWNSIVSAIGGTAETWTMTLPDTSTLACSGFIVEGPHGGGALEDPVAGSLTIELTGQPTFTPAA